MILQRAGEGLLAFRQTEHARLAGDIAAAWGNAAFPPPPRRASALVAAHRHDDGWAEWELAPQIDEHGAPVDFIRIPVREHVALYRRGIDLVEREDPFAGCVVSLHGKRLYTTPFREGGPPRLERLAQADLPIAQAFVAREVERERRLLAALGSSARDEIEQAWRLLQAWDRISLFVCLQPLGAGTSFTLPAVTDPLITVSTTEAGVVELDPYPLREPEVCLEIEALALGGDRFESDSSYRAAIRAARRTRIRFAVRGVD